MIINKKYVRENYPKGYKYLFSYHILNRSVPKSSLYLGAGHNKRDKNEKNKYRTRTNYKQK